MGDRTANQKSIHNRYRFPWLTRFNDSKHGI